MADEIIVYVASITSNAQIRGHCTRVQNVLTAKKIPFKTVDICADESAKEKMRQLVGDPTALPVQFAKGDTYLGSYADFDMAIETETLTDFLKL